MLSATLELGCSPGDRCLWGRALFHRGVLSAKTNGFPQRGPQVDSRRKSKTLSFLTSFSICLFYLMFCCITAPPPPPPPPPPMYKRGRCREELLFGGLFGVEPASGNLVAAPGPAAETAAGPGAHWADGRLLPASSGSLRSSQRTVVPEHSSRDGAMDMHGARAPPAGRAQCYTRHFFPLGSF